MPSNRSYANGKPRTYAAEKRHMLLDRMGSTIGENIRRSTALMWPGVPAEAMLGFTAFSTSPRENTTEAVRTQTFHEIGLYQVEAGLRGGPAPNPDPHATYNSWGAIARADDRSSQLDRDLRRMVEQVLGRPATMDADAWKSPDHWPDQVAIGIANLRRAVTRAASSIDGRIRPNTGDEWSTWDVMIAFTAFSRGAGQLARVLNPYAADLAGCAEHLRWKEWRRLVAQDATAGRRRTSVAVGKASPAYAIVRSEQKLMSGYTLAGDATRGWFAELAYRSENAEDDAIEDAIARAAYGVDARSVVIAAAETVRDVATIAEDKLGKGGSIAVGVGVLGALAAGGVLLARRYG